MKKIFSFIITLFFLWLTQTYADWPVASGWSAVNVMPSWVASSNYTATWCSAIKWLPWYALPLDASHCYSWKINSRGGKAFLDAEWVINPIYNASYTMLNSFIDGMGFKFRHEGTLTLNSYVMDKANNVSSQSFTYKIDKTAPQFLPVTYSDTTPFAHTEEKSTEKPTVKIKHTADIYDAEYPHIGIYWYRDKDVAQTMQVDYNSMLSCPDWYTWSPWSLNKRCAKGLGYTSAACSGLPDTDTNTVATIIRDTVTYPNQSYILKYQFTRWDGQHFKQCLDFQLPVYKPDNSILTKVRFKQSIPSWYTDPIITMDLNGISDKYIHPTTGAEMRTSQISWITELILYKWSDADSATVKKVYPNPTGNMTFFPKDFNIAPNTWEVVKLRLYDNAGNYSEQALELYRDESTPDASKFVFKFLNNEDLIHTWKNSKLILANNSTAIKYDWGVDNDHMAPNIKLKTEKHNNASDFQIAYLDTPTSGTSAPPFELQDVDFTDNWEVVTGNYREYATEFETPGITWNKICDVAGNCINGSTVLQNLRVMANLIDDDKSNLTIYMPDYAHADNPINEESDSYNILYSLRDTHWNRIRNVALWADKIRDVFANLYFTNGLYAKQTSSTSDSVNANAVVLTWSGWTKITWSANASNDIKLEEDLTASDWDYIFNIKSRVPTVWAYKYLKDSSVLTLDNIQNVINHSNVDLIYDESDYNQTVNFNWWDVINLDSDINEEKTNRYNVSNDLSEYWKVLSWGFSTKLTKANIHKLNFEFAAPFVYYAENFNILRDGVNSQHTKYLTWYTQISWYSILEKYFDATNINSNDAANFFVNDSIQNILKTIAGSFVNNTYLAKYDAIAGKNFSKWWYISYIRYNAWDGYVMIPSISRWVISNSNNKSEKASWDFPSVSASWGLDFLTEDIAITWLVNKVDWLSNTSPRVWEASLDLKRPYTRAELLEKLKKKIFTVNKIWNWCTWGNINNLDLSNISHSSCSFNMNGEKVAFYQWDVTINCWNTCNISWKNALIVKDGRVTIKSNINTKVDWGQILIASITDKGLENVTIWDWVDTFDLSKQKWWIAIDENVTNIDAFILAQWPVVSTTNSTNDVIINYSDIDTLINQLHIYGSVFSLNTISWENTNTCPYIEQNCNLDDTRKVYDLSFLRRFTLVDPVNFNWTGGWWNVPYDSSLDFTAPFSKTTAKSSGWLQYYGDGSQVWSTSLRQAKSIHKNAPVIVERDHRWSTNPSYFAKD